MEASKTKEEIFTLKQELIQKEIAQILKIIFSNKRIFVYIDGAISKLSKKIDELTDGYDAIEEKVVSLLHKF